MRTAQRVVRRQDAPATAPAVVGADRTVGAHGVVLVFDERRREHASTAANLGPGRDGAIDVASRDLVTLRAIGERYGASAAERQGRAPTNVARNYYDGGRDFDISCTLTLTFGSAAAAACFLADSRPTIIRWLARRAVHAATLQLGEAELILAGARELELARTLLERIADAQRGDPPRRGAGR